MVSPPLVSIVVPVYISTPQQRALLEETLDTVMQQSCADYELIVVDDGSPLDISEIRDYPRTTLLRRMNGGSAAARNTGIAASRGELIVFLDGDDHLLPRALECGAAALRDHPECGFAIGPREEMTFEGGPVPWRVPPPPAGGHLYNALLGFDWYIIPPSAAMFRREVIERVGGFRDPWGADDLDFYLRVSRQYKAHCFEAPAITRYRRYSASSSRDGERMLRSMRAVYERQRAVVKGDRDGEAAFTRGQARLTTIFVDCLVENLGDRVRARQWTPAARAARLLAWESPARFVALARTMWR